MGMVNGMRSMLRHGQPRRFAVAMARWAAAAALLLALLAGAACQRKVPPIEPTKPGPEEAKAQLLRLNAMARTVAGSVIPTGERTARYKRTDLCHVYEFQHCTVIAYPPNWTQDRVEIILFAGRLKGYDDIARATNYGNPPLTFDPLHGEYPGEGVVGDAGPCEPDGVGLFGIRLGMPRQEVIAVHSKYLRELPSHQLDLEMRTLTCSRGVSSGRYGPLYFSVYYRQGRAMFITAFTANTSHLGHTVLKERQDPVLEEGTIEW